MFAPNTLRWENPASVFIDSLVDLDIGYLDAQEAIERIVLSGHWTETNLAFTVEGQVFYYHRVPKLSPGLKELDVFSYIIEESGLIVIEIVTFAP